MDIYIVLDGPIVVSASARLQGAERIRSDYARGGIGMADEVEVYDRCSIVNVELHELKNAHIVTVFETRQEATA